MLPHPKVLLVSCDGSQGRRVHHHCTQGWVGLQITATVRSHRTCRQSLLSFSLWRERKRRIRQDFFLCSTLSEYFSSTLALIKKSLIPIFLGLFFTALFLQPHLANPLPSVTPPTPLPSFPDLSSLSPAVPWKLWIAKPPREDRKGWSTKKEKDPSLRFLSPATAGFLLPSRDPLLPLFSWQHFFLQGKRVIKKRGEDSFFFSTSIFARHQLVQEPSFVLLLLLF